MTNTLITAEDQKEIAHKIFADRVKALHGYLLISTIPALILCATLVFLGLFELENKKLVLGWYITTLLVCALRFGLVKWYQHDSKRLTLHLGLFIFGTILSGCMWGYAGTMLTPAHTLLHKVFIIIIIAGLDAGGCQTLNASRLANSLFILTSILPFAIWTLFQRDPVYTYLSLSVFGYLVFMLFLAHKSYIQFIRSKHLFYENELLVEKLKRTNLKLSEEILEHEKAKHKLDYFACHDYLTGIDNRLAFESRFESILLQARAQKAEFCIMYIDVDYFKRINDNFGHVVGDYVLIALAKELMKHLKEQDVLARFGGDEFVILLQGSNIEIVTESFCKQVFKVFSKPLDIKGHPMPISISIGCSFYPEDGDSKIALLRHADIALYQAKMHGKCRYEFYKEAMKVEE